MKKYDCIIVCGYPASENGMPSELMKTRVDKACELWKKRKGSFLILSGGPVANEYVEAEVMKKYAVSQGIPEEVIIEEKMAVSTYHNMLYASRIMENNKFQDCIVVTNGWHIRKARHYARKFELNHVMARAKNPEGESWLQTTWRYVVINVHMFYMRLKGYH